ncbi:MAG: PIN domain-containing protein [Deltaproteobacteria bacterium]|nr:PIN domain-containing protein [Deltaproteobacteria bacterium]
MIIPDTSVWIEFFRGNALIHHTLTSEIERQNINAVECVFAELLQGAKNKREIKIISEYWDYLPKIEWKGMWLEAGLLSAQGRYCSKGVGLIDAVIIACAKRSQSKIWTLDKKLRAVLSDANLFDE